jgi:hypothetical protein
MPEKKKKWIQKATANSHGQFRAKAQAAGESTHAFAEDHKSAPGKTGKQARLALALMGASGHSGAKKKHRSKLYDHPRSHAE